MLAQDYLSLRLIRLKPPEEWVNEGEGLNFLFPRGGTGRVSTGPVTQRLATGDALVLSGALGGKVSPGDKGELAFWIFSLQLEHLFPLFVSTEISLLKDVTDSLKAGRWYPASDPVAAECHRLLTHVPAQFDLDHRSQLLRVAAAILTVEFKKAHPRRVGFVRAEEHLLRVFEKLSVDKMLNLSVGDLAARFGCSRRHLNRLFHRHFGASVAALRMEMRLLKAISLLRDPDAKVIRVAEDCGFNHLGLFNTCFKRRFGASPGQWRKAAQAGEPPGPAGTSIVCPLRVNGLCPWSDQDEILKAFSAEAAPAAKTASAPPSSGTARHKQAPAPPSSAASQDGA